uniref:Uncharacterized protein n=1 Tax=Heterorhabditis bacteriophora TaxID=37862 RepID=A0A1I7XJA7_HETBA
MASNLLYPFHSMAGQIDYLNKVIKSP